MKPISSLSDDEIKVLQRTIKRYGASIGISSAELDDMVNGTFQKALERGNILHLFWHVCDYLRERFGDKRNKSSETRVYDQSVLGWKQQDKLIKAASYDPRKSLDARIDTTKLMSKLDGQREKAIVKLSMIWGFTNRELAEIFDIDESRVSQIISASLVRMQGISNAKAS